MEQALFISRVQNTKYFTKDFTRLYFGQEFCERIMPDKKILENVLSFVDKKRLDFTFVTPFVTNRGLKELEHLIAFLQQQRPESEIVFNDWGVFQFLQDECTGLVPVMGRLLNKMKRGPRIMNIFNQLPQETKDFYQGSNIDVSAVGKYLHEQGIHRVEFDNLLQGITLDTADIKIKKSLYMPFAFVSTTRFCMSAYCDKPEYLDYVGIFPCAHECQRYTFSLFNPVMNVPLIRKGNTIFYLNESIPDIVTKQQVDRIVIEPEIPL
jgi:hypothetical protein